MQGESVLVCGPRGIGKTYLAKVLEKTGRYVQPLKTTTRPMRPGEVNGVDYEFLTNEEYAAAAARGEFFMDNEIMGFRYATRRSALEDVWAQGKICVLQIYYLVINQFIAAYPHAYAIYLRPANQKILEDRLHQRCPRQEDFDRELGEANAELNSIGPYLHFYRSIIPIKDDDVLPIVELIEAAVASKKLEAQPA